jgi:hypothetical protein
MQQITNDGRLPSSVHLVRAYPFTRTAAKVLGSVWLIALFLAMLAHVGEASARWLEYGTLGLMGIGLFGSFALMITCTVIAVRGREIINDRLWLFLLGIWMVPYIGVIVALLRAKSE